MLRSSFWNYKASSVLVLAYRTRAQYTVRVLARYALHSSARKVASAHKLRAGTTRARGNERVLASHSVTRMQGPLRRKIAKLEGGTPELLTATVTR